MIIDISLSAGNCDWTTVRSAAQEAERRGYGAVHVLDHLAGLPIGGATTLEAFALLGALAEATTTIELGTMVANAFNRQPGTLVSAAASVGVISGRRFHLGVGAGAAPGSSWAREQEILGHDLVDDLSARHARVERVLELASDEWSDDRGDDFSTFPLPRPRPLTIVGVNSVALARVAGRLADGINVQWSKSNRDDQLDAADAELARRAGDRPFLRTAYETFVPELLDPAHPSRVEMRERGIDRLVLAVFDDLSSWLADDRQPL